MSGTQRSVGLERGDPFAARPPAPGREPHPPRRLPWAGLVVVGLLALLPGLGTLSASWIAEDTAILGYVSEPGWSSDWLGPQYGLLLIRFWRPVVTTAWAAQVAVVGPEAVTALRALNLLAHAGCALALCLLLRRLGVAWVGALVGGFFVATFPEQGGTVTWLAGRTDLLGGLGLLLTLLVAFSPRWRWSAPVAFLACAAKEFAFLAPGWVLLLAWGRGEDRRGALRRTVPVLVGCVVALVARRLALGTWVGGYPAALPGPFGGVARSVVAVVEAAHPSLVFVPLLVVGGLLAFSAQRRLLAAALGAYVLGLAPLYPLLASGHLEPQNVRLLFVSDLALALVVGASVARAPRFRAGVDLALLAIVLVAWRGQAAFLDTGEWKAAAAEAERQEERARAIVAGAEPDSVPVLLADLPRTHGGAYCLGWGVAERFRAPFEPTPRPIWPLRPASSFAESERPMARVVRPDGSLWPDRGPLAPGVERFAVTLAGGEELDGPVILDDTLFDPAAAPTLEVARSFPEGGFEAVVYTELGYEGAALGPAGAAVHRLPVKALMDASNGVLALGQLLMQTADLGATRAYLELRVLDAAGNVRAASPWIELAWSRDLLARTL